MPPDTLGEFETVYKARGEFIEQVWAALVDVRVPGERVVDTIARLKGERFDLARGRDMAALKIDGQVVTIDALRMENFELRDRLAQLELRLEDKRPQTLQHRVATWARKTFGNSSDRARLTHLGKELVELRDKPSDPIEAADCFLILLHHAAAHGYDLLEAAETKFAAVQLREWSDADADGVVEHVRGEP